MAEIIRSVKGTRDFYPDDMAYRRWMFDIIREVSTRFGYQEYEGPCLEFVDLYAAKSGEELVKEQAFVFTSRGDEELTLRPELTPTLARMVAQVTGFTGRIETDPTKPDGTMRKLMDVSRLADMGWKARIGLPEGIAGTYEWYLTSKVRRD